MIGLKKPDARRLDRLDSQLGYHLRRLSVVTMADLAKALAPVGLTPTTAAILFKIGANAGCTQSDIGKALGILRANMTPLANALLKSGLLQREALDGRSQALRLSSTGRVLERRAWTIVKAHEDRMFGSLSAAARASLVRALRALWQDKEASAS